jgi:hypothetical protein
MRLLKHTSAFWLKPERAVLLRIWDILATKQRIFHHSFGRQARNIYCLLSEDPKANRHGVRAVGSSVPTTN